VDPIRLDEYKRRKLPRKVAAVEVTPPSVHGYTHGLSIAGKDVANYSIVITAYETGWLWQASRDMGETGDVSDSGLRPVLVMTLQESPQVLYETPADALDSAVQFIRAKLHAIQSPG
jgi:hypothetical protein